MNERSRSKQGPYEADLYCEIWLAENDEPVKPRRKLSALLPGLAIAIVAALAASFLSRSYGMPAVLGGLLIGFALNFVSNDPRVRPGLELCSTTLLRIGIVLLATRITLGQIADLGVTSLLALVGIMATAIAAGIFAARAMGQSGLVGLLAGGATAICGASAALAIYAVIGRERLEYHRFTFTLVGLTMASGAALMLYPVLARVLDFSDQQAGFLMGAAIHDVAQSLGAGYGYSAEAGETAAIVKLTRVALLAPIVAIIGLVIGRAGASARGGAKWREFFKLPWFIGLFFVLVIANSLIAFPEPIPEFGLAASQNLLLLAIVSTAMSSRLDALLEEGWRGLVPVLAATCVSFIASWLFAAEML